MGGWCRGWAGSRDRVGQLSTIEGVGNPLPGGRFGPGRWVAWTRADLVAIRQSRHGQHFAVIAVIAVADSSS